MEDLALALDNLGLDISLEGHAGAVVLYRYGSAENDEASSSSSSSSPSSSSIAVLVVTLETAFSSSLFLIVVLSATADRCDLRGRAGDGGLATGNKRLGRIRRLCSRPRSLQVEMLPLVSSSSSSNSSSSSSSPSASTADSE